MFFAIDDPQGAAGVADGMKVDLAGNVYATGPGGVWVLSPGGEHLGTIVTGEVTANVAWGDDGRTLYMTAFDRVVSGAADRRGGDPVGRGRRMEGTDG